MTCNREADTPIERILRSWLADPDIILICGSWGDGGLMELVPCGRARLSGPRYDVPFNGLRELTLDDTGHHVHLDLGRLTHAWYVMAPSVCYGYRPSFELRLTSTGSSAYDRFGLGIALTRPYVGQSLRGEPIRRYLQRAAEHRTRFPQVVSCMYDRGHSPTDIDRDWNSVESLMAEIDGSVENRMKSVRTAFRLPEPVAEATP
jgi:hypothetical protein